MEPFAWNASMLLGADDIDDAHRSFSQALEKLLFTADEEFEAGLSSLIEAMEMDFRAEEEMMETYELPSLHAHREEHARVLAALHQVVPDAMRGKLGPARRVLSMLAAWFVHHVHTMDAALVDESTRASASRKPSKAAGDRAAHQSSEKAMP